MAASTLQSSISSMFNITENITKIDISSEQGNDSFLVDFEQLLRHESQENMSPYLYSTPDPNIENDRACGELHYNNLIYNVPEYYLYRDEVKILQNSVHQLAAHVPADATIIEFGVGTEIAFRKKTLPFLQAIHGLNTYAPVDICETYLVQAQAVLAEELPTVKFRGIVTDFVKNVALVHEFANPVVFFKGSTITNVSPEKCIEFFKGLSSALPAGGLLIVGQDVNNDVDTLRRAYTAVPAKNFVLSVFHRFNRDYPTPNFIPGAFKYQFDWQPDTYCVRHTVLATQAQSFTLNGAPLEIQVHQEFHLISSYKYPIDFFQNMAKQGGFAPVTVFSEADNPMVIHVLQKQ